METVVKVLMVLTLATAAAAIIKVDPKEFTCTAESPVNELKFSDTNTPVSCSHSNILWWYSEKTQHCQSQGFHSTALVNMVDNACARPTGNIWCATIGYDMDKCNCCFFYSKGIEVYDSQNDRYVEKTTHVGPKKFLPRTWDATKVVNTALYVFKESNMNGDMKQGNANACLEKTASDDCGHYSSVTIYTYGDNIISTFPVDKCWTGGQSLRWLVILQAPMTGNYSSH